MKKIFLLFVLIALNMTAVAQTTYVVTAETLRVRKAPSSDAAILGAIYRGQEIDVNQIIDGWGIILYKGNIGYVSAKYITVEKATSVSAAPNDDSEFASAIVAPNDDSEFASAPVAYSDNSEYASNSQNTASGQQYSYNKLDRSWFAMSVGYTFQNVKDSKHLTHGFTVGYRTSVELNHHNIGIYGGIHYGAYIEKNKIFDKTEIESQLTFELGPSLVFSLGESTSGFIYCAPAGLSVYIPDFSLKDDYKKMGAKLKADVNYACGFGAGISFGDVVLNVEYNMLIGNKDSGDAEGKYTGGMFSVSLAYNFF